jgi:hypothetical protein
MVVMAVESQTLQFNSHKMLLNNLVRDVFCDMEATIYLQHAVLLGTRRQVDDIRLMHQDYIVSYKFSSSKNFCRKKKKEIHHAKCNKVNE